MVAVIESSSKWRGPGRDAACKVSVERKMSGSLSFNAARVVGRRMAHHELPRDYVGGTAVNANEHVSVDHLQVSHVLCVFSRCCRVP
jgi:hypothetical protein